MSHVAGCTGTVSATVLIGGKPSCTTLKFKNRNFYAFAVTDEANRNLADTDDFAGEEHYMVASDLYVEWQECER